MRYVVTAMILFFTAAPLSAATRFVTWWESYDEEIFVTDYPSSDQYRKKEELKFDSLPSFKGNLPTPEQVKGVVGNVFVLYAQKNFTILLVTPKNYMDNMTTLNEEYKQAIKKCSNDKSWLVTLPENQWTQVDLNPYCAFDYGPDRIRIDLYWPSSATRPFLDIITNSLACVPHRLYGWDRKEQRYDLAAVKCSGNKIVESYPLSGLTLRQVF